MSDSCHVEGSWANDVLTAGLCVGIAASYLPQHYRIVRERSGEGFSPWFLLLGSTSAASSLLNIITMQWSVIKCCRVISAGACLELVAGVIQVGIVWLFFTIILVLYMIYFPPHLKFLSIDLDDPDAQPVVPHTAAPADPEPHHPHHHHHLKRTRVMTDDWRTSVVLAWVVLGHIAFTTCVTFLLVITGSPEQTRLWATLLGVSAAALSAIQYTPQLVHTYRARRVGALSIPSMAVQAPGGALMVLSIALRPGTNWTSWIVFAVAGVLQGALLAMCVVWRVRQRRMGVDDFGRRVDADGTLLPPSPSRTPSPEPAANARVPVTQGPPRAHGSIADALGGAVAQPLGGGAGAGASVGVAEVEEAGAGAGAADGDTEATPLLANANASGKDGRGGGPVGGGMWAWFGRGRGR